MYEKGQDRSESTMTVPLDDIRNFSREMEQISQSATKFSLNLSGGLKAALVDGKSLDSVFRQMALNLSSRVLSSALKPLENLAGSALNSLMGGLGNLFGGLFSGITPFAKGGVVSSPTLFGMAGGSGTGLGLTGEAGAEAILPLARGRDGRLGVRTGEGAVAGSRIQINVAARDAESFRRSEAQLSAMVARAVGRGRRGL